jgi:hypothetical protein
MPVTLRRGVYRFFSPQSQGGAGKHGLDCASHIATRSRFRGRLERHGSGSRDRCDRPGLWSYRDLDKRP